MGEALSDFNDVFSEGADRLAPKALEMLESALDRKKKYRVSCPKCNHHFAAPFPDFGAIAKAIELVRDTGKGKPAQAKARIDKTETQQRKLEELSDDELLAIIGGEDGTVDGSAAEEAAS